MAIHLCRDTAEPWFRRAADRTSGKTRARTRPPPFVARINTHVGVSVAKLVATSAPVCNSDGATRSHPTLAPPGQDKRQREHSGRMNATLCFINRPRETRPRVKAGSSSERPPVRAARGQGPEAAKEIVWSPARREGLCGKAVPRGRPRRPRAMDDDDSAPEGTGISSDSRW